MSSKSDSAEIRRLQREIIKKLGWGDAGTWHSSMFAELSEQIYQETRVMLSDTTIKRFFGVVNHDGMPSITTLDALSVFAGYTNWREFRKRSKRFSFVSLGHVPAKSLYVSAGFILAFALIFLFAYRDDRPAVPPDMSFLSHTVTDGFPNTVVFDLELNSPKTDCLFIQQYWDPTKTIRLSPDQTQATGIYYFPGYFRAKLLADGQVIEEHDLFLKSNGWLGTIDYSPVPKYFVPDSDDSVLLGLAENLYEEISESESPLSVNYHYVEDFGDISGDNFTLEAAVRNTFNDRWAVCETLNVYVLGTKGAMVIPFTRKGCSSDSFLMLSDMGMDGKSSDLSMLGVSLDSLATVGIAVRDRQVAVSVNGNIVFRQTYGESIGRLVGLRFKFLGAGEVLDFSVHDQQGREVPF